MKSTDIFLFLWGLVCRKRMLVWRSWDKPERDKCIVAIEKDRKDAAEYSGEWSIYQDGDSYVLYESEYSGDNRHVDHGPFKRLSTAKLLAEFIQRYR